MPRSDVSHSKSRRRHLQESVEWIPEKNRVTGTDRKVVAGRIMTHALEAPL